VKKTLATLLNGIQKAEETICFLGLIVSTLLICSTVLNRYWLHLEIMWLNDLAQYCFVFFMFLAFAVTTVKKGHVSVDIFPTRFFRNKPLGGKFYNIFLEVLSIVILCIFLPGTYKFMLRAMQYPEYGTLVRWFNTSWLQIGLFFSFALVLIHLLVILRRDIKEALTILRTRSQRETK
jgi:C4-dicarboxylate transporter, DctQ subunit